MERFATYRHKRLVMKRISTTEATRCFGITAHHSRMPNGEIRFRLKDQDGLGYVRTYAGDSGGWQNSHFHNHMLETYIIQAGWIAIAQLTVSSNLSIQLLREGEIWTAPVGVPHNVYMPAGAVTHVVKHGKGGEDDWVQSETTDLLDHLSKPLSQEEILGFGET
jgi:mannose-6-phosphate isomerase-like protein (cupin superfamily)